LFPPLTIQRRLVLGFAVQLALVAGAAAACIVGLQSVKGSFESAIEHGLRVERLAGAMKNELLEARRAEGDFLLRWRAEGFETARRKYVDENQEHIARMREAARQLQALEPSPIVAAQQGRATADLDTLRPYVNTYSEDFAALVGLIGQRAATPPVDRGGPEEPLAGLAPQIDRKIEDFRSAAIVIESIVGDIAVYGHDHAAAQIRAAEAASRKSLVAVAAWLLTALLSSLGIAYLLGQQIRRPLERLARAAAAVGAGDLTVRAEGFAQDEIGTVAAAFNGMTGQLRALVVSLEDRATERARAEQALRTSQQLLESIIDASPAVIYVKDLQGRFLLVNQRFAVVFRVAKDSVLGKTDHDLFPRELADAFRAFDRRVLAADQTLEAEETAPHEDGLHTYLSIKCPLHDVSGKTYAVCGISTDITERKRVEEQLRQSQKMDAIGRLAGGIAHDFNNLLTVINGYCSVIQERTEPEDPTYLPVLEIAKAGGRAAELTRQLLAYSRSQVLAPRVWSLNTIVSELQPMLRRTIGEDIDLSAVLGSDIRPVRVDRSQIEQLLLNLVVNAREAMPEGGSVTVQTSTVVFDGEHRRNESGRGPHTMLAVADTGGGMTPSVRARAFEPFFTTRPVGKGAGLGLSVVYGIVKQSGGSITVESEPGRGTTFRIYFPVAEPEPEMASTLHSPDVIVPRGGTERILLVEDEEAVRRFAREVLEDQGYSILEASNGREAQDVLAKADGGVALVITDVVMPELGGRALSTWIRERSPEMRILFVSGYSDDAASREGLIEAGELLLQKPFGPAELCRRVRERLDR
jgi:PAS domain S-box-containing protein